MICAGRTLALALFVFDLVLGLVAAIWPELYVALLHPERSDPQIELIRRNGALWLGFAVIAFFTAVSDRHHQASWFLVLGWLRLIEVPADTVYSFTATGSDTFRRAIIFAASPINLLLGGYLIMLAHRMMRSRRWRDRCGPQDPDPPWSDDSLGQG